jgi:hypothetical protein
MKTETVEPGALLAEWLRLRGHGYSLACLSAIVYGADRWVRVGLDRLRVSEGDFKLLRGDPVFSKMFSTETNLSSGRSRSLETLGLPG